MTKITTAQIDAIKEAPASEKTAALARRLKITEGACGYYRRMFKKAGAGKPGAAKTEHTAKPAASKPAPKSDSRTVSLNVSEETLNSWWMGLDFSTKVEVFTVNFRFRLEGTVS